MIVLVATIVGMASAVLSGGRLRRLAQVELRTVWLIWATIVVQTVIFELPPTIVSDTAYAVVHVGTYVAAFVFLWLNRHIPGALIIGLGAAANAIAIAANGGVMPASPSAWRAAGLPIAPPGEFENSDLTESANLAFLGDIFHIPESWPLSNVFSIGDIVIVIGGTYFAHVWCRRARTANAWPAPSPSSTRGGSHPRDGLSVDGASPVRAVPRAGPDASAARGCGRCRSCRGGRGRDRDRGTRR